MIEDVFAMGYFSSDGGTGSVKPVYLSVKGADLLQIFPTQYNQTNSCVMLGSPSESGIKQFDNKVIQPATVQLTGIVKYPERSVFTSLRNRLKELELSSILCTFQSKAGSIQNMIIESVEEIGESNRYDGIEVRVTLREYLEHNEGAKK